MVDGRGEKGGGGVTKALDEVEPKKMEKAKNNKTEHRNRVSACAVSFFPCVI